MAGTWESAVEWLRSQPDHQLLVEQCYFDDPLLEAARRYAASEEWTAIRRLLPCPVGRALDVGAGRGISSFALAQDGWEVVALEPDPSSVVGAGAIRELAAGASLEIAVVEEFGEKLPFADATFDLVLARQVLHHAANLAQFCREVARILRPGGKLVATREHVISKRDDLPAFLASHPLHALYGGENAFLLSEYVDAFLDAGLRVSQVFGPYDSVINYFPMSYDNWRLECIGPLRRRAGSRLTTVLTSRRHPVGRELLRLLAAHASRRCDTPGRLYSFVAEKRRK